MKDPKKIFRNRFWEGESFEDLRGRTFSSFDELLEETGLDFTAEQVPLLFPVTDPKTNETEYFAQPFVSAIVRQDDKTPLGVNSTIYGINQYRQWFAVCEGMLDSGVKVVAGGLTGRGARAYLVLQGEETFKLVGSDHEFRNEFVLSTSHDGTAQMTVHVMPVLTKTGTVFNVYPPVKKIKHSKHSANTVLSLHDIMVRIKRTWKEFNEQTQKLSLVKLTEAEARGFIESVVGDGESTKTQNIRAKVFDIWKFSPTVKNIPACNGTLFGLVNAFCEYAANYKTVRRSKYFAEKDAILTSKTLGDGAKQMAKAWSMALAFKRSKQLGFEVKKKS